MDVGVRSPLIDQFRRGEVSRDVRLLAAQGGLAPRAHEQVALLILLVEDADQEIVRVASGTLDRLPKEPLSGFLARADVPGELRAFFARRGVKPAATAAGDASLPLLDATGALPEVPEQEPAQTRVLTSLPVIDRMKLAMKGTREQRAHLIRDSNRLVAAAVLSSPKLTEAEVEAFAKMANVAEEVLRVIAANRNWLKNYGVVLGLTKNPKTPPAISMRLLPRLTDKDIKMLSNDRNVSEMLRFAARKAMVKKLE